MSVALCAAPALAVLAACGSDGPPSTAPTTVPTPLTIAEIETQLGHPLAQPNASLGAELRQTGVLQPSGDTFRGRSAATTYSWRGYVVILRQGPPQEGWTLRGRINRSDATFETRADGAEVAYLPPAVPPGATPNPRTAIASALIVSGGWLVQVSMAAGASPAPVTLDALKAFVAGIDF